MYSKGLWFLLKIDSIEVHIKTFTCIYYVKSFLFLSFRFLFANSVLHICKTTAWIGDNSFPHSNFVAWRFQDQQDWCLKQVVDSLEYRSNLEFPHLSASLSTFWTIFFCFCPQKNITFCLVSIQGGSDKIARSCINLAQKFTRPRKLLISGTISGHLALVNASILDLSGQIPLANKQQITHEINLR